MSETKHSRDPWLFDPDGNGGRDSMVRSADAAIIAVRHRLPGAEHEANMRRIVACVNACAGIPTEALEAGALGDALFAAKEMLGCYGAWNSEGLPTPGQAAAITLARALGKLKP